MVVALGLLHASCTDGLDPWDHGDLLDRLNALPGVEAREIQPHHGYQRTFQLDITQPVNHRVPQGRTFTQRAYLSHVDVATPMVFAPAGYGTTPESGQELAWILRSNCLSVAHRYFPESRPSVLDWRYLDIWQAAEDHHRVVTLVKEIYSGPWISAGSSKGGETVLFHRRFHPDDVVATVAYVAPLLFSDDDPRFMPYLRGLGTPAERAAIHAFQRTLLERKRGLLDDFIAWFPEHGYSLSLPAGPTFESVVSSYEWEFWQRHIFESGEIPGPDTPDRAMIAHLAAVVRLQFESDVYREYFQAYVYQALTEIGDPRIEADHLADLLEEEPPDVRERYGFPPDLVFAYRPEVIPDVLSWIQTRGDRIVLIYGALDPWTAGAVELLGLTDALKIIQPGADHRVRIAQLDRKDDVLARLASWLGMRITMPPGQPPPAGWWGREAMPLSALPTLRPAAF
jgi:hypothetical protein